MKTPHQLVLSSPLILLLICVTGGCASQPKPAPSRAWPATFSGRQLYFEQGVLVYARKRSIAQSTAQHIVDLGSEFTRTTGRSPMAGLVIVNDLADSRIGNLDLEKLLPEEKQEPQLAELGISVQEFVLAMGLPVSKQQMGAQPGFTPAAMKTVQWLVSIPSQKRVEQFGGHLIDAGIRKENFNLLQRLMIAPFMPFLQGLLNDALNAERDSAIYQCFCDAQSDWSPQRRKKEAADYAAKRMGEVVSSLKAATQQAGN